MVSSCIKQRVHLVICRTMKCEVTMYRGGTIFKESYVVRDYQEARKVAKARNPDVTIVGVNAVFD